MAFDFEREVEIGGAGEHQRSCHNYQNLIYQKVIYVLPNIRRSC